MTEGFTEFVTKGATKHGGRITAAGGLGGVMLALWLLHGQLEKIDAKLDRLDERVAAVQTQVAVLDAIRENSQAHGRSLYE